MTIPDSVTSIGDYAFSGCSGLTSVTIPNSVTSIESFAFNYCTNLTSVTIPNSVTSIGYHAFDGCSGLTSVTIPNSVTSIGDGAFYGCSGLVDVEGVVIVRNVFYGYYGSSGNVTIPDGVTSIGEYAFKDCNGLTSVTIPDSVTSIESSAFYNCSGLTSVTIPDSVTSIGDGAFYGCTNLTSIAIPYSVEKIGQHAFGQCNALFDTNSIPGVLLVDGWAVGYTEEEFPTVTDSYYGYRHKVLDLSGVRGIADRAFNSCSQLQYQGYSGGDEWTEVTVRFGDYMRRIGASAFGGCDGVYFDFSGLHIGSIGEEAFYGCWIYSSDGFENVDTIDDGAFLGCYGLEDGNGFVVVRGVLHEYKGRNSSGYVHVDIPNGVTHIGHYAFGYASDASAIKEISIPDSVTSIAPDAFCNLNLEHLSIGKGLSSIAKDAFGGSSIKSITIDDENPYYKVEDGLLKTKGGSQIIYAFGSSFGESVGMHGAWATGGDVEWSAGDCARSGAIGDGQESWLEVPVSDTGVISFCWKASSEAYRDEVFDFATFSVDGVETALIGGEVDWTNITHLVVGNGPHVVRWTYKKDGDGSEGEDCVWLDNVQYVRKVCVSFSGGDEAEGNPPEPMIADLGAKIVLPGAASLVRAKHTFAGWWIGNVVCPAGAEFAPGNEDVRLSVAWDAKHVATPIISVDERFNGESTTVTITCETPGASIYYTLDGTEPTAGGILYEGPFDITETATINAIAVKDDWFDSETASAKSVRIPVTLSGCLNSSGLVFRTGGAAGWTICLDEAQDGEASARSGNIEDGQVSWIETEVVGAGMVSFWWKVSSEASKKKVYDRLRFTVDGEPLQDVYDIGGEIGWTNVTCVVGASGTHVLRWTYEKDDRNEMGEDCAWLDAVSWTPSVSDGLAVWLAERNLTADAVAANGRTAAECYALGLDPALSTNDFRIVSIELVDGKPKVEWEPKVNRWTGAEIQAVLKGAESLDGEWKAVEGATAAEKAAMRFFKVVVEVP